MGKRTHLLQLTQAGWSRNLGQHLLIVFSTLAVIGMGGVPSVAAGWHDLPQTWYSLNGRHVTTFRNDRGDWYAEVRLSNETEILWEIDCERPLLAGVSNDGKAIAIVSEVQSEKPSSPHNVSARKLPHPSALTALKLSVLTSDERRYDADSAGVDVVEPQGKDIEPILAIGGIAFEEDGPVVTFVANGRVVGKLHPGRIDTSASQVLPRRRFVADSCRRVIEKTNELTWKFGALATRSALNENAVTSPMSIGLLAATALKTLSPADRAKRFQELLTSIGAEAPQNVDVDSYLYGMRATGCLGWSVPDDGVGPKIDDDRMTLSGKLLTDSPTRFWTDLISGGDKGALSTSTQLSLSVTCDALPAALHDCLGIPGLAVTRSDSPHSEISLRNRLNFSSEWAYPFKRMNSEAGRFRKTVGRNEKAATIVATFMQGNLEGGQIAQRPQLRMARVSLLAGWSVVFLLSEDAEQFEATDKWVFNGTIGEILLQAQWRDARLKFRMPRVALSGQTELSKKLSSVFSRDGLATNLCPDVPLHLTGAIQSTDLNIDEDGIAASTKTTVNFSAFARPEPFVLDQPFHLCVLADDFDFPVLVARVVTPENVESR